MAVRRASREVTLLCSSQTSRSSEPQRVRLACSSAIRACVLGPSALESSIARLIASWAQSLNSSDSGSGWWSYGFGVQVTCASIVSRKASSLNSLKAFPKYRKNSISSTVPSWFLSIAPNIPWFFSSLHTLSF